MVKKGSFFIKHELAKIALFIGSLIKPFKECKKSGGLFTLD
jgi:hypothetical protein